MENTGVKFRVWNNRLKRWEHSKGLYVVVVGLDGSIYTAYTDSCESPVSELSDCVLSQFTTWLDCWNNEIYKEDIVSYNGITLRVSFYDGKFCFYSKEGKEPIYLPREIISHFKVIGDMFETPQLFK